MKYQHTVDDKTAWIDVVETEKHPKLVDLDSPLLIRAPGCEYFCLRESVANKLYQATTLLPKGYQFKIFETYRSIDKQKLFWARELAKVKALHPDWSTEKVEEEANNGIANPYKIGSGHQTGAALDLTLCKNGKELNMGTPYLDTNSPKARTWGKGLTVEQMKNRSMLYFLMAMAGLVNYRLEWWHYSYGEQEWAVTTDHPQTLFAQMKMPSR